MTSELENFFQKTTAIRQTLGQVFPPEAVDHIIVLIIQDNLYRQAKKRAQSTEEGDETENE